MLSRTLEQGLGRMPVPFSHSSRFGKRVTWNRTMEMDGRSTASYLVRTPRVRFSMLILIGLEAKGLLAFQRRGIASVVRWNLRPVIPCVAKWLQTDLNYFRIIYGVTDTDFNYLGINYGVTDTDLALLIP